MNTQDLIESVDFDYDENDILNRLRASDFAVRTRGGSSNPPNTHDMDWMTPPVGHDFFPPGSIQVIETRDHWSPILKVIYRVPEGLRMYDALSVLARGTETSDLTKQFMLGVPGEGKGGTEAFVLLRDRDQNVDVAPVDPELHGGKWYGNTTYRY